MSMSKNPVAYADCYENFERAIVADRGLVIKYDTVTRARYEVLRMNQARVLDRRTQMKVLPEGHPRYGFSDYDILIFRRDGSNVYITRHPADASALNVEEL